jgi:transposase-like protein
MAIVDVQTKLRAVADLEAGDTTEVVAARYGVSRASIYNWKTKWDAGELGEEDDEGERKEEEAPEAAPPPPPPPRPKPQPPKPEPPMSKQEPSALRGVDPKKPGLVTETGAVLPSCPPQPKGAQRNIYPDSFKYALAKAMLDREVTVAAVAKHYALHESLIRSWCHAVTAGKLKRPKGYVVSNGAQKAPAAAAATARQTELSMVGAPGFDPVATAEPTQIVPYREPTPPPPMHPAQVLAEVEYLRRENRRLKRRLEQALNMVLDDDHDDASDGRG